MPVIEITSLEHPGVDVFGTLTEAQLRNRIDPEKGHIYSREPQSNPCGTRCRLSASCTAL